jgi:hypothetical protein
MVGELKSEVSILKDEKFKSMVQLVELSTEVEVLKQALPNKRIKREPSQD